MSTKAKTPRSKAKSKKAASLPTKALLDEMKYLRTTFRDIVREYAAGVEGGLAEVLAAVTDEAEAKTIAKERAHNYRDMMGVMRGLDIKPAKGRRRDLKKIESAVEDLREIAARW